MQNKGFVKFIAAALTLICLFYLSFSVAVHVIDKKAEASKEGKAAYLANLGEKKVYMWKTYKECQALQVGLGLDLKGGMNVILEVSVPDVVRNLAGNPTDAQFTAALNEATKLSAEQGTNFIDNFQTAYAKKAGQNKLAGFFAAQMKDKGITFNSTDAQVKSALNSEVQTAVENSYNVVRTRIDRFGVAQPNIQVLKGSGQLGQIMVELPGIEEPERVRKLLQGSANLEFWETYDYSAISDEFYALQDAAGSSAAPAAADSAKTSADSAKAAAPQPAAAPAAKGKSLNDLLLHGNGLTSPDNCILGFADPRDTVAVNRIIFSTQAKARLPKDLVLAWGVKAEQFGDKKNAKPMVALYALRGKDAKPYMSGDVVANAKSDFNQITHAPIVSMEMNTAGAREWAVMTRNNVKHCVAIVLDGFVYSAPRVNDEITDGRTEISGSFTTDDTRDLANVLSSGKMPAPMKIVSEETVGPTMGQQAIHAGLISCVVAFVLLMIFMCCYYGFIPGMVANGALLLNFFFTFGTLVAFQAALTMSGIAGMVLSLGMAVDANVLIYERTKEELAAGKNIKQAVSLGYSNAFSAIFDSNLTSIITALILYNVGKGPIQGFAFTLAVGICASFFTAVWMSRLVYEHQLNRDKWLNLTFTTRLTKGFLQDMHVRFMQKWRTSFSIFGVLILIGLVSLGVRGLSRGIDFTGGRNYVIYFENQDTEPESVRNIVADYIHQKDPDATVNAIRVIQPTGERDVRLTTNYLITSLDQNADAQVEHAIYDALHQKGLVKADFDTFKDRQNHEGGSIVSAQTVGNNVAKDTTKSAVYAVILSLFAIFIYILARFRNVAFSVGSIVALTIDTFLIIAMYSLCYGWMPFSLEIDQTFIGAILTAIGYSINDKVVVFDRIRENLHLWPKRDTLRLFNDSLNETLARTIMTSGTTLLVLLCIFILGGDSIRSFAFAMILGVIFGTLSSIFIAAPVAYKTFGKKKVVNPDDGIA